MFDRDDTTLFCPLYWEKFMKGITALGIDLPTEIMSNLFGVRIFFFKQVHNSMLVLCIHYHHKCELILLGCLWSVNFVDGGLFLEIRIWGGRAVTRWWWKEKSVSCTKPAIFISLEANNSGALPIVSSHFLREISLFRHFFRNDLFMTLLKCNNCSLFRYCSEVSLRE